MRGIPTGGAERGPARLPWTGVSAHVRAAATEPRAQPQPLRLRGARTQHPPTYVYITAETINTFTINYRFNFLNSLFFAYLRKPLPGTAGRDPPPARPRDCLLPSGPSGARQEAPRLRPGLRPRAGDRRAEPGLPLATFSKLQPKGFRRAARAPHSFPRRAPYLRRGTKLELPAQSPCSRLLYR